MPNTVQAAAERMPNTTRRTALALTGAGLVATLAAMALPAKAEGISAGLADLIADYHFHASLSIERCERCQEAEASPGCPPMPNWQPTGRARLDLEHNISLHSSEYAELFFAERVEKARDALARMAAFNAPTLERGHAGHLRRIETYRDEALAVLRGQEAAYAPILALQEAAADATEKACDALTAIYAEPCHSFADVRAKAALLLHADEHLGLGLYERDHIDAVLKSLLGKEA